MSRDIIIESVVALATTWSDPDHDVRISAVEQTLARANRFTLESVTYAINYQMESLLRRESVERWLDDVWSDNPLHVAVLNAGNIPFVGMQDLVAVVGTGNVYHGVASSKSPYLLPAFGMELNDRVGREIVTFAPIDTQLGFADALIATGSDKTTHQLRSLARDAGLGDGQCLLRGHTFGVAVIDGSESDEDLEGLAVDILLHEGMGCRSVAIIWAPESVSPDAMLAALAQFRAVFPAHAKTVASLKMPAALLAATNQAHAMAEDLSFLVSKGKPEPQQPGHVRWTTYGSPDDVRSWLEANGERTQVVVTSATVARAFGITNFVIPGESQRPPLEWCPNGRSTIDFVAEQIAASNSFGESAVPSTEIEPQTR